MAITILAISLHRNPQQTDFASSVHFHGKRGKWNMLRTVNLKYQRVVPSMELQFKAL